MQFINWPQYALLPQNRGLTTEQIRQRYMWYLAEQAVIVESVTTTTSAASSGGGRSTANKTCYKYYYIETTNPDFTGWRIDGSPIWIDGRYNPPTGLEYVEAYSKNGRALYIWFIGGEESKNLRVYNPEEDRISSVTMLGNFCETKPTATALLEGVVDPNTTFIQYLIIESTIGSIIIDLGLESTNFLDPNLSTLLTTKLKEIYGTQASCAVTNINSDYLFTINNIYIGEGVITYLQATDNDLNEYQAQLG